MPEHYDVIIIGTGAGGGTLANTLAPSGKRILLLERGNYLPREMDNWDPGPVFVDGKYISPDTWYDADGNAFQPQVHYFVGGATKLYGAALYRLRPQDFRELQHVDGVSPAWPLTYDDFEPWYTQAEWLYQVHGNHGEDPTEGHWSKQYPWPAVSHEPRIQQLSEDLVGAGYHPFHSPCGILLDEANRPESTCIRCTWCDGYPCLVHAKSDAETIGVNDFYFGASDYDHPIGNIQMVGKSNAEAMKGEEPKLTKLAPHWSLSEVARHAVDFWLTTEDLPKPENRVTLRKDGSVQLAYQSTNDGEADRLYHELKKLLNHVGMADHHVLDKNFYMDMSIPVAGVAHQVGTTRFGNDPATSVLDANCKAHELDNLYVTDTSFFPSIGAVNPALTAMANAIRVGEHLQERMG
jgi:choline dehydrogenase-like flavoprotein